MPSPGCCILTLKMYILRLLLPALLAAPLFCQPAASILLRPGRSASQPVDEEYTKKIREYTTETVLQFAAHRLSAGLEDRAHAQGRARRRRRRARHPALFDGSLSLHADAGKGQPAREGLHHRQDRRRPRDDRGRGRVRETDRAARRESRAPGQARRSPHHQHGRRRGRQAWSPPPRRFITSPAPSTPPKPARPPR